MAHGLIEKYKTLTTIYNHNIMTPRVQDIVDTRVEIYTSNRVLINQKVLRALDSHFIEENTDKYYTEEMNEKNVLPV